MSGPKASPISTLKPAMRESARVLSKERGFLGAGDQNVPWMIFWPNTAICLGFIPEKKKLLIGFSPASADRPSPSRRRKVTTIGAPHRLHAHWEMMLITNFF